MASIYDITGRAVALNEMANDEEVELEVFRDTLEAIEGEFDDKIESYCKVLKNIEGEAAAITEEVKRLNAKKKAIENNVDRMKKVMFDAMKVMNKESAGGAVLKAKIQKNGGKLPLMIAEGTKPESLPFEFQKITYDIDNDAVREALDNGQELDFAKYGERGESLRIK